MSAALPLAFAGGSFIFLAVIVVIFFAVAYGYFTKRGSGINTRSWDGESSGGTRAPGAKGPESVTGKDEGEGSNLDTHGTH